MEGPNLPTQEQQRVELFAQMTGANESFVGLTRERAVVILEDLYGAPTAVDDFDYFINSDTVIRSHPFEDMPVRSRKVLIADSDDPKKEIIQQNVKGRMVIELGGGPSWVYNAIQAKEMGAAGYVCIDIDKNAVTRPDWEEIDYYNKSLRYRGEQRRTLKKDDLAGFAFPVVDDPITFLSRLDDHSAVIISSALFSEPLEKDLQYGLALKDRVRQKTFFGAHIDGPGFDTHDFIVWHGGFDRLSLAMSKKIGE